MSDTSNNWTTLRNVMNGQLVEFMDGRFGVKVRDNQVQFCRTVETDRAGSTFIGATTMSNTMMERAQVRPVDLGKLFESERDARVSPSESQVRPVGPNLPDVLPFFDEQIDVQALLTEVAQAHEQDRSCMGGEPQMIDRLAHIIRTYRGMETRDGTARIGAATGKKSVTPTAKETVGSLATELAEAHRILHSAGAPDKQMSDEHGTIRILLAASGVRPPCVKDTDSLSVRLSALLEDLDGAFSKLDWPNDGTLIERIAALPRLFDAKSAAITSFWQDIRSIVGPVDVTDVDREAVTEEDAANGPDAREYYAERKALLRRIAENAGGVKNLSELRDRHVAARNQFELELSEIRDVLSKAGHTVDTHEQLMGVLLAIAGEDAPLEPNEEPTSVASIWHSKYSSSYNRRLVKLLSAYAYAGDADVRDVMNALPMTHVRARIVAIVHAIETLAIAHGMDLADHLR